MKSACSPSSKSSKEGSQHLQTSITAPLWCHCGGKERRASPTAQICVFCLKCAVRGGLKRPSADLLRALRTRFAESDSTVLEIVAFLQENKVLPSFSGETKSGELEDEAVISKSRTHEQAGELKPLLAEELLTKKTKENNCNAWSLGFECVWPVGSSKMSFFCSFYKTV